ncbi:hypothetical protein [uncultured Campylobacter sp.]|uniref:hypothetical protein n=1 Tax=uncultured Campylobacter sp. TaxID=218934 RepID=UPI0015A7E709|nr:hypothetical protein [uncultured Campylobacter sp.]
MGFKIPPLRNSKFRDIKFLGVEFQNLACADKVLRNFIGATPHKFQAKILKFSHRVSIKQNSAQMVRGTT